MERSYLREVTTNAEASLIASSSSLVSSQADLGVAPVGKTNCDVLSSVLCRMNAALVIPLHVGCRE